jgi:hypothetical protein
MANAYVAGNIAQRFLHDPVQCQFDGRFQSPFFAPAQKFNRRACFFAGFGGQHVDGRNQSQILQVYGRSLRWLVQKHGSWSLLFSFFSQNSLFQSFLSYRIFGALSSTKSRTEG